MAWKLGFTGVISPLWVELWDPAYNGRGPHLVLSQGYQVAIFPKGSLRNDPTRIATENTKAVA